MPQMDQMERAEMSYEVGRGLNTEKIEKIKSTPGLLKYVQSDGVILGIRNDRFNIYYRGASIGKFSYSKGQDEFICSVSGKYARDNSGKNKGSVTLSLNDFFDREKELKACIDTRILESDNWKEKSVQSKLVQKNNSNINSAWYCVDIEYVMQRRSKQETCYGRFDITALSKKANEYGKYTVALIEVKCGSSAYGGKGDLCLAGAEKINPDTYIGTAGSGLLGHMFDYNRFLASEAMKCQLRRELAEIINNQRDLGICRNWANGIDADEIDDDFQVYFLTFNADSQTRKAFCGYMFNEPISITGIPGKSRVSEYNIEKMFGADITTASKFSNYHFWFSESLGDDISDILDAKSYHDVWGKTCS